MPSFNQRINRELNGFEIRVYDINLDNEVQRTKVEEFLIGKIKKMKIHQGISQYASIPGILPEFLNKISVAEKLQEENMKKICNPIENSLSWFDVRRSRVTEFMSQILLEKQLNCVFFDETDKRINLVASEADSHVKGIDVTGIQKIDNSHKFVICEVKASKSDNLPCSSANDLLNDVKKAYDIDNQRLSREIKEFISVLGTNSVDKDITEILEFIFNLYLEILQNPDAKTTILENVIFLPFLIRKNPKIIQDQNIDDFKGFNQNDLKGINLKGLIWVLNEDIDNFCSTLYNKALDNEN